MGDALDPVVFCIGRQMTLPPGTTPLTPLLGNRPILDKYRHQITPILVEYTILVECPILVRFGHINVRFTVSFLLFKKDNGLDPVVVLFIVVTDFSSLIFIFSKGRWL